MAEPFFVEIEAPDGTQMLLNLDLTLGILKAKDGKAIVVTLTGTQVPTGQLYDTVVTDFLGPIKT